MSAYTTKTVTRDYAIATIVKKVYELSNYELEEVLFDLIGEESLNNFIVKD